MIDRTTYRRAIRDTMVDLTAQSVADGELHVHQRLAAVTAASVALIRDAEFADVMLVDQGRFQSVAATDPLVTELDAIQMHHGRGPCLEAATSDAIVRSADLHTEGRWPEFTSAAVAAGIRSALTFQLYSHRHGCGALNIFGRAAGAFNIDDEAIGAMIATHGAIMLVAAGIDGHPMNSMLTDGDVIGQAKGILMERFVIDAATAFDLLLQQAKSSGTTAHAVAAAIVESI